MLNEVTERLSTRSTAILAALVVTFIVTRLFIGVMAVGFEALTDVETAYQEWSVKVVDRGRAPYSEVRIEYPPGALPFVLAPEALTSEKDAYRIAFVALMALVDSLGFLGLLALARKRGSLLGPWMWTIALGILGPLIYLRLDLVPAVATIWALQRSDRDDWLGAGALLGFAIVAKAYAVVLVPIAFMMCPRDKRARFGIGVVGLISLFFIPFIGVVPDVVESVAGYHAKRGIQIESLWGSILFIARSGDYSRLIIHDYGAHHFFGGAVPQFKLLATAATLGAIGVGTWLAKRSRKVASEHAGTAFATITLVVAVASVFSPQFLIWVIALAAVAVSYAESRLTNQALALIPVAAITRWVYPTLHPGLVVAQTLPVIVLWCRNILMLLIGLFAIANQHEEVSDPSTVAASSPGTP